MSVEGEDPGSRSAPGHRRAPARSWAELNETTQDGFAVLDTDDRFAYVSDHFLSALGTPAQLVNLPAQQVLLALSADDPRQLKAEVDVGTQIDFEQYVRAPDGSEHWYRITVIPSPALGGNLSAVVFARDISSESRRFNELRHATAELTRVENERHRRISREVHDGPVQLLAALVFRLGVSEEDGAVDLQRAASDVASALRSVIEEFSPVIERVDGAHLKQWIAPMLVDSGLDVTVEDRRVAASGLAEAQAAFVLLYQVVRAVRDATTQRTITLQLNDEEGGERIILTLPSSPPEALLGERAARLQAIVHHAQALGGTLTHWLDEQNLRTVSMWIPKLTDPSLQGRTVAASIDPAAPELANDISALPPLEDTAWLEIVDPAPERMAELDADFRFSFVNAGMARGLGLSPADLIAIPGTDVLSSGVVDRMDEIFEQVQAGEFSESHWRRTEADGSERVIQLAFTPRFNSDGTFGGVFLTTNDHADDDLLDELYETALADLTIARHLAIEAAFHRLAEPLRNCQRLVQRLDGFELITAEPGPIRAIRRGLETALRSIKNSSSVFTAPPQSVSEFDEGLRQSLGAILGGRQIVVVDTTTSPLPAETFEVMFRITREAVNNAVIHGRARTIIIALSTTEDGSTCTVHDDGVGLDPTQLSHQPGHLGTRSMQARASERGGTCTIEPHPAVGTVVNVWLPADPNRRSYADGSAPR